MIEYSILISLNLGNAFSPVGDVLKRVNTHLSSMGCQEQLSVRSKMIRMSLKTERELNEKEKQLVKEKVIETISESNPAWEARVESFRRKSGNVQQSVS